MAYLLKVLILSLGCCDESEGELKTFNNYFKIHYCYVFLWDMSRSVVTCDKGRDVWTTYTASLLQVMRSTGYSSPYKA